MNHRFVRLVAVWSIFLASSSADAQPSVSSPQQQAKAKFEAGLAALDGGDPSAALPFFQDAWTLSSKPVALINVAVCEAQLALVATASRHYQEALAQPSITPAQAREVKSQLASNASRIPTLRVRLDEKTPAETTVLLDGTPMTASTLDTDIRLNPGTHAIIASAPDYVGRLYSVTLKEGAARTLIVSLQLAPQSQVECAPPPSSSMAIPVPSPTAKPMSHVPAAALPTSSVATTGPTALSSHLRTGAFVTFSVAGIAAVTGAVTGRLALDRSQELRQKCPIVQQCDPALQPIQAEAKALADGSTAAFVLAGAAFAGGVTMFLLSTRVAKPSPQVGVTIGPGTLSVQSRF